MFEWWENMAKWNTHTNIYASNSEWDNQLLNSKHGDARIGVTMPIIQNLPYFTESLQRKNYNTYMYVNRSMNKSQFLCMQT